MPIYEYLCPEGHVSEAYSTIAERHALRQCRCGKEVHLVILHPPKVFGDYEGYESPASGKWIEGRRARERDFAETGTRPYELGERADMVRRQQDNDRRTDAQVDEVVERTLNEMTL